MKTTISEIMQHPDASMQALVESIKQSIRCAAPGIVRAYDGNTQTASVELAVRDAREDAGYEPLPLLLDVPVFFPGGSGVRITYPINVGDECLVVFADQCIDSWFEYGGVRNPPAARRHDLSDGFALVGFSSKQNAVPADGNAFSVRVRKNGIWETPLSVDTDGNVRINGIVQGGE